MIGSAALSSVHRGVSDAERRSTGETTSIRVNGMASAFQLRLLICFWKTTRDRVFSLNIAGEKYSPLEARKGKTLYTLCEAKMSRKRFAPVIAHVCASSFILASSCLKIRWLLSFKSPKQQGR